MSKPSGMDAWMRAAMSAPTKADYALMYSLAGTESCAADAAAEVKRYRETAFRSGLDHAVKAIELLAVQYEAPDAETHALLTAKAFARELRMLVQMLGEQ